MTKHSPVEQERAFLCWIPDLALREIEAANKGVYRAATASKARYQCYLAAREAFGPYYGFWDIKVQRAPEFDGLTFKSGIMPQYIER